MVEKKFLKKRETGLFFIELFFYERDDERTGTKCTNCIFGVQLRTIFPWRIFFLRQEDTRIRLFKIFVLRRIGKKQNWFCFYIWIQILTHFGFGSIFIKFFLTNFLLRREDRKKYSITMFFYSLLQTRGKNRWPSPGVIIFLFYFQCPSVSF